MSVSRKCAVCQESHLLTRDGLMSIHDDASGKRCAGSVGQAPRELRKQWRNPVPRGDCSQPPLTPQRVPCPTCAAHVQVNIYGTVARHFRSGQRRGVCPGSGAAVESLPLRFTPAVRAPRQKLRAKKPATPLQPVQLDPSQPAFSGHALVCDSCTHRVPATVHGRFAWHRVLVPAAARAKGHPTHRLCPGSDAAIDPARLGFAPTPQPGATPQPEMTCVRCGVTAVERPDGQLAAHQRPSLLWCSNGATPTEAQRANGKKATKGKKGKSRRSVWAVGGGLPTLGKGR